MAPVDPFLLLSPEFHMKSPAPTGWQSLEFGLAQSKANDAGGLAGKGRQEPALGISLHGVGPQNRLAAEGQGDLYSELHPDPYSALVVFFVSPTSPKCCVPRVTAGTPGPRGQARNKDYYPVIAKSQAVLLMLQEA